MLRAVVSKVEPDREAEDRLWNTLSDQLVDLGNSMWPPAPPPKRKPHTYEGDVLMPSRTCGCSECKDFYSMMDEG